MIRLAILVSCIGFLVGLAVKHDAGTEIKPATTTQACTHGESSTMVEVRGGKTVVVQPPTLTGCLP